jgi:hypothetical protein
MPDFMPGERVVKIRGPNNNSPERIITIVGPSTSVPNRTGYYNATDSEGFTYTTHQNGLRHITNAYRSEWGNKLKTLEERGGVPPHRPLRFPGAWAGRRNRTNRRNRKNRRSTRRRTH